MPVRDKRRLEELKPPGAGKPAPGEVARLYARAFAAFGVSALMSRRPSERSTVTLAMTVADALRAKGDLAARALSVGIEAAGRAAL